MTSSPINPERGTGSEFLERADAHHYLLLAEAFAGPQSTVVRRQTLADRPIYASKRMRERETKN